MNDSLRGTGLTDGQLAVMKKNVLAKLQADRTALHGVMRFVGNVAMSMNIVPVRDVRCPTACTDMKNIFFSCEFCLSLSDSERLFVLAHEIWHCVMLHGMRRQGRDAELFNVASDMEVNNILTEPAAGSAGAMKPPKDLLYPPKDMRGNSAEVIYEWLRTPDGRKYMKSLAPNTEDGLSGQFDRHEYEDGDSSGGFEKPRDRWGDVGFDPDFKPRVAEGSADSMREKAFASMQDCRMYGDLPAGIENVVSKIMKPEIDWRTELCNFVTSRIGSVRRTLPPNRRFLHNDQYFPSRRSESIKIGVFIDTSGSTIGALPKFFGELNGIVGSFGSYEIHRIDCDCEVDFYRKYDEYDCDIENETYESHGGGGTSLDPPFRYIEDNGIDIDMAIYMTDGYAPKPTVKPPPYPVLWLVCQDGARDFCDWGRVVRFKEEAYRY